MTKTLIIDHIHFGLWILKTPIIARFALLMGMRICYHKSFWDRQASLLTLLIYFLNK